MTGTKILVPCPHCQQETRGISHFRSEQRAMRDGEAICPKAPATISYERKDRFSWACPPGHVCHMTRPLRIDQARPSDLMADRAD